MAIKVYGHPISPPVKKVLLCLAEKGLEYDYVHVDLFKNEQKMEPVISINPFGQIPAFEDGDLKLFESRAITRYIAHAYAAQGTPLLSDDPKKMAIISVWLEVEALRFDDACRKLSFEIVIKPLMGLITDETAVDQLLGQLASVLDEYEAQLGKSKYLVGDSYTLADLHHVPQISNLIKTKVNNLFFERPHVSAWCVDLLARPAWQKVLADNKVE